MNFSAIPYKSLLGKSLRLPLRFIPREAQVPILQGRLSGKRWVVGSSTHGCWMGSYEYQKRRIFEQMISVGSVVFDIGEHVGFYTLLASVLVKAEGHIFAFEPSPRNLLFLKEHLRINHITNVNVIEAAVADHYGHAYFDDHLGNSMGRIGSTGQMRVPTISLDEYVGLQQIPMPDYIKIDVEGAEMLVLRGAQSILTNVRPTLFLATHGRDVHEECCAFLTASGYRLSALTGGNVNTTDEILAYGA